MIENIIEIKELKKTYDKTIAVDNLNFKIQKGQIIGLLGPNGAGKTTLISMICGIIEPSSGSVSVNGFDVVKDYKKTRSIIGLVLQELVLEYFEIEMTEMYGEPYQFLYSLPSI